MYFGTQMECDKERVSSKHDKIVNENPEWAEDIMSKEDIMLMKGTDKGCKWCL